MGHDWGAVIAWYFCLFRPDRVKALVNLSVPFLRRNPSVKTVDGFRAKFGDDYYVCRFQVCVFNLVKHMLLKLIFELMATVNSLLRLALYCRSRE